MNEDEILESNFYSWWAAVKIQLDERAVTLQGHVDSFFDVSRYAGIGEDIVSQRPFSIDLRGVVDRIPYTITLSPGKSPEAVLNQFDFESKGLLRHMGALAGQLRIIAGGAMVQWVRPLKVNLVMPPTTEELIKFSGLASGFFYGDAIKTPVAWVGGRVIIGAPTLQ